MLTFLVAVTNTRMDLIPVKGIFFNRQRIANNTNTFFIQIHYECPEGYLKK
jgi:hypothetical protein